MKCTNLILLIFSAFLLQHCGKKNDGDSPESSNTIEITRKFLLGDVQALQVEVLDTINLEAPGNPVLTAVQDIAFSQDFFLVLDNRQGLLKFDNNGSFIRSIGEMGEGPEEFTMSYAIHLDEKENLILVADWIKRIVLSFDLEGSFISSSDRLPGSPVAMYKENDSLLVIQEGIFDSNSEPRQVLISAIEPKTLELQHQKSPLYSYDSKFTIMHRIPRILSRVNNASLFYIPIIREQPLEHRSKDTIYRKVENRLVPEYFLNFTGFDQADQLGINHAVVSDDYAFLYVVHNQRPHFVVNDLVTKRPTAHSIGLFDQEMTLESMPRPLRDDVFYSILRDGNSTEEKNPLIVFYRIRTTEDRDKKGKE